MTVQELRDMKAKELNNGRLASTHMTIPLLSQFLSLATC